MGLFDYVKLLDNEQCPYCNVQLDKEYQTKSTNYPFMEYIERDALYEYEAQSGETIRVFAIDNFYTKCNSCETWVEYTRDSFTNQFVLEKKRQPIPKE